MSTNFTNLTFKNLWPLLPLLVFCTWPFVQFTNENRMELLFRWVIVILPSFLFLVTVALSYAIWLFSGRHGMLRKINVVAVTVLIFFSYNHFDVLLKEVLVFPKDADGFVKNRYVLGTWFFVGCMALTATWYCLRGWKGWLFLTTVGSVALLLAVAELAYSSFSNSYFAKDINLNNMAKISDPQLAQKDTRESPNIFFIVYDGYSRHDYLDSYLDLDNLPFLSKMESKGFFVARNSFANYPITLYSIGSTFLMNYLPSEYLGSSEVILALGRAYSGDNNVVSSLKNNGYKFVFSPIAESACIGIEDLCLVETVRYGFVSIGEMEIAILKMSPLYVVLRHFVPGIFNVHGISPKAFLNKMKEANGSPMFVFYHNMDVHSSLIRMVDGKCVRRLPEDLQLRSYLIGEEKEVYADAIRCANEDIIEVVDHIIGNDPDAIIIIQSDHGVRFGDEWGAFARWSPDDLRGRFGILNLMRVPTPCRSMLYDSISPINTFRVIFRCLGIGEIPVLPDASYWISRNADQVVKVHFSSEILDPIGK